MASPAAVFAAGCAVVLSAVFAYYRATWHDRESFAHAMDHGYFFADYFLHFVPMGREILRTHLPVTGWYYSPLFAILLSPLSILNPATAFTAWCALQALAALLLCLVPGVWLLRQDGRAGRALAYVALCATSHPLLANFAWGQTSTFVVLALVVAFLAYSCAERPVAATLVVLAASVKYYPAMFAAHFAARREYRTLAWMAVFCVLLLVVVPAAVLGPGDALRFQKLSEASLRETSWFAGDANTQFVPHVLARLAGGPRSAWLALSYAVFAADLVAVWLLQRGLGPRDPLLGPIFLFLSIPFVVRTSWPHYFGYLPFCQVFLWRMISASLEKGRLRAVLCIGVAGSALASNVLLFNAIGDWKIYGRLGLPLCANILALAVAWTLLVRVRGASRDRNARRSR